jgi:hypothetical protein
MSKNIWVSLAATRLVSRKPPAATDQTVGSWSPTSATAAVSALATKNGRWLDAGHQPVVAFGLQEQRTPPDRERQLRRQRQRVGAGARQG